MSAILLGLKDSEIAEKDKTTYLVNKIGGLPDWIEDDCKSPQCKKCQNTMLLVVQLYCPLEGSPYHRTLYIFTCINKECWNHPHSWQILRSQVLDKPVTRDTKQKTAVLDDDWGVNSADWDMSGNDCELDNNFTGIPDERKKESDDWGTDADDWGIDTGDVTVKKEDEETNQPISHVKASDPSVSSNQDVKFNVSETASKNTKDVSCNIDNVNISSLNMYDFEDGENDVNVSSIVQSSDNDLLTEDGVNNVLGLLATGNQNLSQKNVSTHTGYICLASYYIEVVEESVWCTEDTKHVQKLIQQYKQTDNIDLQNTEAIGGKGGESYEKELAVHGDAVFHKFMKKSSVCPQQCIRYQWNGTPLFISTPKNRSELTPRCVHCGEETVYELQLMPALVNVLQIPGTSGPATEFGTVIIHTCRSSCWNDKDNIRQEQVLVQADPDQHLFNR